MAEIHELAGVSMSNDLTKSNLTGTGLVTGSNAPKLLDKAFEQLTPEQKQKLLAVAGEQAIAQEIKDREAQRRFDASGAEMQRHVSLVREHERNKSDFTATSEFETASGKTTVRVSRANNTLYIVIAVVIAVVFFVVFSR